MKDILTLRCYCCGGLIRERFSLVAYKGNVDRVFIFRPECVPKVEDHARVLVVVSTGKAK